MTHENKFHAQELLHKTFLSVRTSLDFVSLISSISQTFNKVQ